MLCEHDIIAKRSHSCATHFNVPLQIVHDGIHFANSVKLVQLAATTIGKEL